MRTLRRLMSALVTLAFLTLAWLTWLNVWSPLEPIQSAAEQAACAVNDCAKRHGVTRVERSPFGQTFVYTWEKGEVSVGCQRASMVMGPVVCRAQ